MSLTNDVMQGSLCLHQTNGPLHIFCTTFSIVVRVLKTECEAPPPVHLKMTCWLQMMLLVCWSLFLGAHMGISMLQFRT